MTTHRVGTIAALAACLVAVACKANPFGGPRDDAALIIFYGDTTRITAPAVAARGESFDVTFVTFAGGCTRSVARDDVALTTGAVEIRPYDRNNGGEVCTSDLLMLEHSVRVRVDAPGSYVIRVVGHQRGGATGGTNASAELTRPLAVQ
jgi:hypothetical protein